MSPQLQRYEALIAGLMQPSAYGEPVNRVERIDTHISTVLLAGRHAYKVKKPLALGFLDFSTLEQRRRACEVEVRLNRRTAPELYLGVVGIRGSPEAPQIDDGANPAADDVIEVAVRMRRFDPGATLDRLAQRDELGAPLVDRLAAAVAAFHAEARPVTAGGPLAVERWTLENFSGMRPHVQSAADRERLDGLEAWSRSELAARSALLSARAADGHVRECHGDLHLGNVVRVDGEPIAFDAVEFNAELRCIDVVNDVAFTFMDLLDHHLPRLAWRFIGTYLEHTGDYEGLALLRFFAVYRALVRAKVALIRLHQPDVPQHVRLREHTSFEHYLALAEQLRQTHPRLLVAMSGLSGSGKSTVAQCLAERIGGVRIRSDAERKRLFGIARGAASGGAIYSVEANDRTYARLEQCARATVDAGVAAVIDAACLKRSERKRFRVVAEELGAIPALVVCEAPLEVLRQRVERRMAEASDPSEADLVVLERQRTWREPLEADERRQLYVVDTAAGSQAVERGCATVADALLQSAPGQTT